MAPITFVENSKYNDLMFAVLIVYCIFAVALAGGLVKDLIQNINKPDSDIPRDWCAWISMLLVAIVLGALWPLTILLCLLLLFCKCMCDPKRGGMPTCCGIRCCGKGAAVGTVEGGLNGSGGAAQNTGSNAGVVNQPPTNNHEMELPSYNQAFGSKQ